MILRICPNSNCKKQFDVDIQTILCPHTFISKLISCKKHNRFNCGNFECKDNLREIRKEKNG